MTKTYRQMTREELISAAQTWLKQFGGRAVVYQAADGDAGLVWHDQQGVPENTVWTYAAK